jgi:uncharacterized protein (DUF697 family)
MQNNAFLSIFAGAGAFIPIPYNKVITITAGDIQYIYTCFVCCVRGWKR